MGMTETLFDNGHWTIEKCDHSEGRVHIMAYHSEQPFPLCWNISALRSLGDAIASVLRGTGL